LRHFVVDAVPKVPFVTRTLRGNSLACNIISRRIADGPTLALFTVRILLSGSFVTVWRDMRHYL
jgi:hypothetical protein